MATLNLSHDVIQTIKRRHGLTCCFLNFDQTDMKFDRRKITQADDSVQKVYKRVPLKNSQIRSGQRIARRTDTGKGAPKISFLKLRGEVKVLQQLTKQS